MVKLRQSAINPANFSVILVYKMPGLYTVFRLRRHNGKHFHTNVIEGNDFHDFHVHTATERYQKKGLNEDYFAEVSTRHHDLQSAIECLISDCGFGYDIFRFAAVQEPSVNLQSIKDDFKRRVCEKIDLQQEGEGRFLVVNPFRFNDGDHYGIVLKKESGSWILTDEASTLMHLSYQLDDEDFESGSRGEIIEDSLEGLSVQNRDGELVIPVAEDRFRDALFSFIQAITKITEVSYLSRERVRSTFLEDFKAFMRATVPEDRLSFDWTDEVHDKAKKYPVDARVNHMAKPLLVYPLPSDEKVKDATISLLNFEKRGIDGDL
jgi:hypothetical protein